MAITLKLNQSSYKRFIKDLRKLDKNSGNGTEIQVDVDEGSPRSYFFVVPNFQLAAFKIGNGSKTNLLSYNHVLPTQAVDLTKLTLAFLANHTAYMDATLSTIVSFTSEAARSDIVYQAFQNVLGKKGSITLTAYDILFQNYAHTCKYSGFVGSGGGFTYTNTWRPLVKSDYEHYFGSNNYTGSKQNAQTALDIIT